MHNGLSFSLPNSLSSSFCLALFLSQNHKKKSETVLPFQMKDLYTILTHFSSRLFQSGRVWDDHLIYLTILSSTGPKTSVQYAKTGLTRDNKELLFNPAFSVLQPACFGKTLVWDYPITFTHLCDMSQTAALAESWLAKYPTRFTQLCGWVKLLL